MSKRDVSPKIKEPRKQSKKPKKHRFFYRRKQNQDQWLLYVTHQKNQYTHLYYYVISMFHEKKIKLKIRNRKSFDCAPPEKRIEKTTRTLELELPLLKITVFLFVDVSFSPKKIPSCTLTKRKLWMYSHTLPKVPRKINYYTCSALKFNAGFILHKFVQLNAEDFRILAKKTFISYQNNKNALVLMVS